MAQWVRSVNFLTTYTSLSPIRQVIKFTSYSPGTPASSTTKTGCHDIDGILLKVAVIFGFYWPVIWPFIILALDKEPVIQSLLDMGFTFTDVAYAVNEYTKQEDRQ